MNRPLFTVLLFCVFWVSSFAQVTFTITSIPENTPDDATIYAAGNFNSWNDGNADYALTAEADGTYTLTFEPAPGTLEFKFTRGSWATVEGNAAGGYLPNRTLNYEGGTLEVDLEILSWEGDSPATSTAADNVFLLDEDFYMPQLDRNRRIWIYLPPDYNTSDATYPVLYMHDGQNLFDAATAAFGEWEVDESLNALFQDGDPGVIVVGIDNGGGLRLNEYSPWINPSYGGGEGAAYVDFIVETLKPYIDDNYRTRPEREATGIMGSSMGGLISLYAAIEHQDVFSKAGVFSASFWFASACYDHVAAIGKQEDMRIYLIAGAQEGSGNQQVIDMLQMEATLLSAGFSASEINAISHSDGEHAEWYWRREFPMGYEWLFAGLTSAVEENAAFLEGITIFPNPGGADTIEVLLPAGKENVQLQVFTSTGKRLMAIPATGGRTSLNGLTPGVYQLAFYDKGGLLLGTKQLVVK
ncbi:MAG: T9SS type A sorting domain-containing protein [Phaeodactylibacter sp.]|nr:T9SS type A sorting domain-containing protein [Phaeodactylibacter sp.]